MTDRPLDEKYFSWLYDSVRKDGDGFMMPPCLAICRAMHRIVFNPFVANDDNRAGDALDLRFTFRNQIFAEVDSVWMDLPVSIFEVLVGLSLRAEFMSNLSLETWFQKFIENLALTPYLDRRYRVKDAIIIDQILRQFNDRSYDENGQGGLFPLREPKEDQRKVEIWYQLSAYIIENQLY